MVVRRSTSASDSWPVTSIVRTSLAMRAAHHGTDVKPFGCLDGSEPGIVRFPAPILVAAHLSEMV
jgi:hypothetical protein